MLINISISQHKEDYGVFVIFCFLGAGYIDVFRVRKFSEPYPDVQGTSLTIYYSSAESLKHTHTQPQKN